MKAGTLFGFSATVVIQPKGRITMATSSKRKA